MIGDRWGVTDEDVARGMRALEAGREEPKRPFAACKDCGSRFTCDFRRRSERLMRDAPLKQRFLALIAKRADADAFVAQLKPLLLEAVKKINLGTSSDAAWCCLLHMTHHWMVFRPGSPFALNLRKRFRDSVESVFQK